MKKKPQIRFVEARRLVEGIDLSGLDEKERRFWKRACDAFRRNIPWLESDHFVLGKNHFGADPKKNPLYRAVQMLWIELGIAQGLIKQRKRPRSVVLDDNGIRVFEIGGTKSARPKRGPVKK